RFKGTDTCFLGYLRGEELASAYASADAFVYASEMETMGNVVLEAMACGCPVVAPKAGGIPDLLVHGATGFLFQPGDVQDAVHWTRQLLDHNHLRTRTGQAARQAIEERSWEHSIGRVRQTYLQAIDAPKRPVARPSWSERAARVTIKLLVSLFKSAANRKRHTAILPRMSKALPQEVLASAGSRSEARLGANSR